MKEYDNPAYDSAYVRWAHEQGFLAESAYAYGLDEHNVSQYLSDYDYYKIWPLNSWSRIWINDKLTLKYLLDGTEYADFMPKYYFYSTPEGLHVLVDAPRQNIVPTLDEFRAVLSEVGEMGCKPCNGTTSLGFHHLACQGDGFTLDGEPISAADVDAFVTGHPNYVFTEYLRPSDQFRAYAPTIHTLRVMTINEHGYDPWIMGGYLRLPNKLSGEANYIIVADENRDKFNVFLDYDGQTGAYGPGKLTYVDRAVPTNTHPDTGLPLSGLIEDYDALRDTILGVCRRFSTVEYMGFDIGFTPDGPKCMEINSHPGIKYVQIFHPLMARESTHDYFSRKIARVDALDDEARRARTGIVR
jgi:hypothetical protein